jgi:hypothetical protein
MVVWMIAAQCFYKIDRTYRGIVERNITLQILYFNII